jgi:phosphoenolpyruvate phosphomutase
MDMLEVFMILVSAGDAIGAKLVKEAGFDGIWVSGFEASARLGYSDNGTISLREMLGVAKPVIKAVDLPVYVDVDTGYDKLSETVKEFENIGAAGVCIEDVEPAYKQNSLWGDKVPLMPIDKFIKKLDIPRKIHVIARTESLIRGYGEEECMTRMGAYSDYADYILPHSRTQPLDVLMYKTKPFAIVPTKFPEYTNHRLRTMGYSMIIWANQTERVKIKAVRQMLRTLNANDRMLEAESELCTDLEDMRNLCM